MSELELKRFQQKLAGLHAVEIRMEIDNLSTALASKEFSEWQRSYLWDALRAAVDEFIRRILADAA